MIKGYAFILSAAACWGVIGIFSSIAFEQGLGPMEVAFWRALITWFFFGAQALVSKQVSMKKKDAPLMVVFALLGISLFYISYQFAVKQAGAAFASVLLYTAPAWVVISSRFIYKERLTWTKLGSVFIVISGVFLISKTGGNTQSGTPLTLMAVLSGLTAGFCYSLYYTMGKYFSGRYSSANLFLWLLPIGVLGILPFVEFVHKTPVAWAALAGVSLVSTFLANICYYRGLKHLETGKASIVATMEPVVAAVTAYFFLGEYFTFFGYMGAGLIILAVVLTIVKN
ncbi:MAG: EamA family transporter [Desulfobacter sp.]|nr:EamA family transporter [Desulfobacter sp.]